MVIKGGKCGCFILINKWHSWVQSVLHEIQLYVQSGSNDKKYKYIMREKINFSPNIHASGTRLKRWNQSNAAFIARKFRWSLWLRITYDCLKMGSSVLGTKNLVLYTSSKSSKLLLVKSKFSILVKLKIRPPSTSYNCPMIFVDDKYSELTLVRYKVIEDIFKR